jgi:hypothetical protein
MAAVNISVSLDPEYFKRNQFVNDLSPTLLHVVSVEHWKHTSDNDIPLYHVRVLIFRVASQCILSWHLFLRITCYDVTTTFLVICFGSIKEETFHSNDDIIFND